MTDREDRRMADRIVDLTHSMYDGMPTFPGDPEFALATFHTIESIGYNMTKVTMPTHAGTHLDAPCHFLAGGKGVDEIDLSRCIGEAHVLDFTRCKAGDEIGLEDIAPYDGLIAEGARLLLRTGWDKVFPRPEFFTDMPGISVEVAELFARRKIALVGMDMPTVHATEFKIVHEILLGAEIVIVESLANLGAISRSPVYFVALPLKFRGRDGSPVRAIAVERDASESC